MPEPRVIREAEEIVADLDSNSIFDRIAECELEWDSMKLVLAFMGVPQERMDEHHATFTIAFWRGVENAK